MNKVISIISGVGYRQLIKPVLFMQSPDDAHNNMLWLLGKLQQLRAVRMLLRVSWAYHDPERLRQTLHGVTFENPLGLSAGFDKNFELPPSLKAIGFGLMEGGSLTLEPTEGNPRPWFHRLQKSQSLVVNAGLANEGVEAIIKRIKAYPVNTFEGFPLNISVAKTNSHKTATDAEAIRDYVGSLKRIQAERVGSFITLNISCPNTYGGEPFTTPQRLEMLLGEVDTLNLSQPVFIKMPVNLPWSAFKKLLEVADKHRVAGLTIGNLSKTRNNLKEELPSTVKGNLSGKPTFELSNDLIAQTYRAYHERFTIIGVGGVFSAEDAYTKIRLGASLVEMITGMIFEGPQIVGQINAGLVRLLKRDGYSHIYQAIGVDAK